MKKGLKTTSALLTASVSAIAMFSQAPAGAQQTRAGPAATASANVGEDADTVVIVTGVVKKTRKLDTTFTIDTIDQKEMQRLAPISTADLLNNIPGFFAEGSTAGEASNNITVRGLPVTGGYRYAPQLIDGLPVFQEPDIPFMNNDVFIRGDLMTSRVEAIKGGPGGILYSNGLGATVNWITKTGGDKLEGGYKVEVANYGFIRNDAYLAGPINDNFHFAVGGFYRVSDGIRDTGYTADKGGQIRGNITYNSNDGKTTFGVYAQYINDRTAFFQNLPIEVPGFSSPGTPDNPIKIDQDTVTPIGLNFQNGTTLSPFNRHITQVGEYGQRTTDIGDGIHPDFKTLTAKASHEFDGGWTLNVSANYTTGTSGFNTIFTGNDASTSTSFLQQRFTNDVLQPAFDAQWQQSEGNPNNSPFQNRYKLATYFNAMSPADFNTNIKQPILDSGFSQFDQYRTAWANAAAKAGAGVGLGAFYVDDGQAVPTSSNLTFLIPWIVKTQAKSAAQDIQLQKEFNWLGNHHLTFGIYHSDYSDSYNYQASLVVSTLDSPTKLVDLKVINASGQPVGPSLSINGSFLPGFYGNVVSGGAQGYAGYIQDHWETLDNRLKLDIGYRWETEKMDVTFQNRVCCTSLPPAGATADYSPAYNEINLPGPAQRLNQKYSASGWSVGANYAIKRNLAVYGLVSNSFRLPSFNDGVGFAQAAPITDPVEHIDQYEVGMRYQSRPVDVSLALYYNQFHPRSLVNSYQDIESPICNAPGAVTNINTCPVVTEAYSYGIKNYGMELEVVYRPSYLRGFEIKNNIVLQDPKVEGSSFRNVVTEVDSNNQVSGYHYVSISQDGRRPGRLATINLNIQPSWDLKPLTQLPIKLYGQYEYHSSRYSNSNDVNVTLYPAYYLINLGALWDINDKLSLQVHVANLTNQLTFTEGDPLFFDLKAPDGTGNRGVARPLFGRTYRAFLNYRF